MSAVVVALPGNAALARALADRLGTGVASAEIRQFPDGEWYVRVDDDVAGRDVVLAATLAHPDRTLVPAWLAAATARDLGATRVGLVAPYLPYLRQDARFRPGEGITSRYVARWLSAALDWVVTVDPHLHRWPSLDAIYGIPTRVVPAAPAIAAWVRASVPDALLVGPDAESAQWVSHIATLAGLPHIVCGKVRHGDREVAVRLPDLAAHRGRTPVIVDDIVSTARTLVATVGALRGAGFPPAVCVGVHALFAPGAEAVLRAAGVGTVVTTDTVSHDTNGIAVTPGVVEVVAQALGVTVGQG